VISGAVCSLAVGWPLGWAVAAGMLVGTAMGWLNFRWLAASVNAIGDRIVKARSQERGAAIVARGVGRIFLIALVAYGIFAYSVRGLMGFLAGLAMPVIAMMCEAVYEFVASSRRPS
jgi:ATP synthase I chain